MRILRTVLYTALLVVGVVVASANMTPVHFVYVPPLGVLGLGEGAETDAPLALLLLLALLVGTLIAGTGTFVEHIRIRLATRRQKKINKGLQRELEEARHQLAEARVEVERLRSEKRTESTLAIRDRDAAVDSAVPPAPSS